VLYAVVSLLVGAGCVLWRLMALRRVSHAAPARFFGFETAQRPRTRAAWSAWSAAQGGVGDARHLVQTVLGAGDRRQAVACLNEHLAEIAGELSQPRGLGVPLERIALLSGALFGVIALARRLSDGAVSAVLLGVTSAALVRQIDRLADARARRVRAEWDEWARALERLLPADTETRS